MRDQVKYVLSGILVLTGLAFVISLWMGDGPRPEEKPGRIETAQTEVLHTGAAAAPGGLVEMEFFDWPKTGPCALPGLDLSALPEETVVYVGGALSGQKLGWPIDRLSSSEGTLIKVTVNSPRRPVLLMLGAYEPTVWRIEWTSGTRILGAALSGYHSQFVSGLPSDTPVLISSYDQKRPCGYFYVNDHDKQNPNNFSSRSLALFGREPEMLVPAEDGQVNIGPKPREDQVLVSAEPWRPEDFQLTGPLPGEFGLNQAVTAGLIRPALARDHYQWRLARAEREKAAALAEGLPERLIPPPPEMPVNGDQPLRETYVVLSPDFILPEGLNGGYSADFLLPPGIPLPYGNLGHSQFRFMEDGRSMGPHQEW